MFSLKKYREDEVIVRQVLELHYSPAPNLYFFFIMKKCVTTVVSWNIHGKGKRGSDIAASLPRQFDILFLQEVHGLEQAIDLGKEIQAKDSTSYVDVLYLSLHTD